MFDGVGSSSAGWGLRFGCLVLVLGILVLRFNAFGCSCVLVLRWVCAGFGVWLGLDGVAGFGCLGFIAYWCLVAC